MGYISIVFVHGLRGGALNTWTTGNVCWPRDLLAAEMKNARIITVRKTFYGATILRF